MALAIIFPEIIISEALNQRLLARRLMLDVNKASRCAVSQPVIIHSIFGFRQTQETNIC